MFGLREKSVGRDGKRMRNSFYSHIMPCAPGFDFPMPSHTELNGLVIRERERAGSSPLHFLRAAQTKSRQALSRERSAFDFNYGGMTLAQCDKMENSPSSRHAFSLQGSKIKKRNQKIPSVVLTACQDTPGSDLQPAAEAAASCGLEFHTTVDKSMIN